MWKMQTSNTASNIAQLVLCSRNIVREISSITYVVVRHDREIVDRLDDITVRKEFDPRYKCQMLLCFSRSLNAMS